MTRLEADDSLGKTQKTRLVLLINQTGFYIKTLLYSLLNK